MQLSGKDLFTLRKESKIGAINRLTAFQSKAYW